jgi:hypothetical protein
MQARLQTRVDGCVHDGGPITAEDIINRQSHDQTGPIKDVQAENVTGSGQGSQRTKIRRTTLTISQRIKNAGAKAVAIALMIGASAGAAFAQTTVNEGVPLKPVEVRVQQERNLGTNAPQLMRMRSGHTLADHQQRASVTYPFLGAITLPQTAGPKMSINAHESLWRMISIAAEEAEGTPELTNMIPTSPVNGSLVWQPQIEVNGRKVDVLPMLLPQLKKPDGSLDLDKLKQLYLRVNNPSPRADANGVFLAENIGFQNGRAGYFSINAINPEPVQPHDSAGTLLLPQLTLEVNGRKTVYTIGALCYKGGGPSFKPDGSYAYGYSSDRQKTPLNMTDRRPIYAGNSSFGLFELERASKANDYGWQFLDNGAYVGMSIMHFKLDELVDYQVDKLGKPTGEPTALSIAQLQKDGRVAQGKEYSLLWRAFETEYRLSSFKNPDQGVAVLNNMRQLFARDVVFDYIANNAALSRQWTVASAKVRGGGPESAMTSIWTEAITGLNAEIRAGTHYLKDPITMGSDNVATLTIDDYVRTAIERSARNVVVLHKLGFTHNSIAAGGDNINAAWQMVDLDDLNKASGSLGNDPKDHSNVSEMTSNLQMMVDDLKDRVPEMRKYDGRMQDLLKQAIDREAKTYGKRTNGSGNG